jgi:hypothetical protein
MSETLGKMEKPEASQFKIGRKLFFVPLVFRPMEEDPSLAELTSRYWVEVESQLANLESKLSDIKKIYHELLPGKDAIKRLNEISPGSHRLVEVMMGKGAALTAIEDDEILEESMDWGRCLSVGLQNPTVFNKVYEAYMEAHRKREEHIGKRIDETLLPDETAVLLMREGHRVQFPADIQVFYVAPPSLDAIQRALRERQESHQHEHEKGETEDKTHKEGN